MQILADWLMATLKLVNLTPHPVQIVGLDKKVTILPACPTPVRLHEHAERVKILDYQGAEITISAVEYTHAYNLPRELKDTLYVVSQMVAQAYPERDDLVFPYDIVRNEDGSIFACRQLGRWIE